MAGVTEANRTCPPRGEGWADACAGGEGWASACAVGEGWPNSCAGSEAGQTFAGPRGLLDVRVVRTELARLRGPLAATELYKGRVSHSTIAGER